MQLKKVCQLGLLLFLAAILASGCGAWQSAKHWAGYTNNDEDTGEIVPPEARQTTVMIDGKPYVRSKNPYWLTYPDQPEYLYVPKGEEFHGLQDYLIKALAEAVGKEKAKSQGKAVPPDKLKELVQAEVNRILKQQGLGGFVSRTKGASSMIMTGRAVAVIPDLDTPASLRGLNRTLSMAIGASLGGTKGIRVSTPTQVDQALGKTRIINKQNISSHIKGLGDALGVQAIVLTGLIAPQSGSQAAMVFQVYNAFTGLQEDSLVAPALKAGLTPDSVTKFAKDNTLRLTGDLAKIPWFGRVAFIKAGKVYLNLGQNSGLKVGSLLKVVTPGKEVINPTNNRVLGYTADISQGEVKVTELLGDSAAVATPLNGGPFKANDKVKPTK
jgi:hypothetical protein